MSYLRSFAPWIIYAIATTKLDWRLCALIGLVIALGLVGWELSTGKKLESMVIELSAAVFFALVAAIAFAAPDAPLHENLLAMSSAWLALTAWGSLAIRRPFTLGIARTMVEREIWDNPLFRRTNVIITMVWAISFTVEGIAAAVITAVAPHMATPVVVLRIASFTVPVIFTIRYSAYVRARAVRSAA
ncbi:MULTISPECIES: hypothetical protein [Kribbella]|jgi:hypothetical protein|uniref:Intracellular septation protein A n=1 Tax=Kribbella karoonensis TaxID=324851 RepID=A0ABN2DKK7_9ACTN